MGHLYEPNKSVTPDDNGAPEQGEYNRREPKENTAPVIKPKVNTLIQAKKEEVVYTSRPRSDYKEKPRPGRSPSKEELTDTQRPRSSSLKRIPPVKAEPERSTTSRRPQSERRRRRSLGSPQMTRHTISSRIENIFNEDDGMEQIK